MTQPKLLYGQRYSDGGHIVEIVPGAKPRSYPGTVDRTIAVRPIEPKPWLPRQWDTVISKLVPIADEEAPQS